MNLTFAIATEADACAVAAVRNSAAECLTRRHGQGRWSTGSTERAVLRDLSRPRFSRVLIARNDIEIVGTLVLQTKKPWAIDTSYFTAVSKPLYLVSMAVRADFQRQGVGRRLLQEAELHAREWPADALRLDAFDGPAGAGPFYAKCNYREVGRVIYRDNPLVYFELML
jgi:GNAT superfamily N-acetyltransferase